MDVKLSLLFSAQAHCKSFYLENPDHRIHDPKRQTVPFFGRPVSIEMITTAAASNAALAADSLTQNLHSAVSPIFQEEDASSSSSSSSQEPLELQEADREEDLRGPGRPESMELKVTMMPGCSVGTCRVLHRFRTGLHQQKSSQAWIVKPFSPEPSNEHLHEGYGPVANLRD